MSPKKVKSGSAFRQSDFKDEKDDDSDNSDSSDHRSSHSNKNQDTTQEGVEEEKQLTLPKITLVKDLSAGSAIKMKTDSFTPVFNFDVLEIIAQGKMSLIHKGLNLNTGRDIIVKYSKLFVFINSAK